MLTLRHARCQCHTRERFPHPVRSSLPLLAFAGSVGSGPDVRGAELPLFVGVLGRGRGGGRPLCRLLPRPAATCVGGLIILRMRRPAGFGAGLAWRSRELTRSRRSRSAACRVIGRSNARRRAPCCRAPCRSIELSFAPTRWSSSASPTGPPAREVHARGVLLAEALAVQPAPSSYDRPASSTIPGHAPRASRGIPGWSDRDRHLSPTPVEAPEAPPPSGVSA